MNIPGDPRDVSAPIDAEAATPVFDSRPPYDGAGEAKQHKTAAADTMNKAARGSYQQVFVKAHEPLDDGVPSQFVAKTIALPEVLISRMYPAATAPSQRCTWKKMWRMNSSSGCSSHLCQRLIGLFLFSITLQI